MSIKSALQWGFERLKGASSSARLDAEILLAHVLKKPVTFLLAHDETRIGFWPFWRYKRFIEKRKKGMPVAYLIGHREFYFLDFEVNPHVLIPRPDTEILVEEVIEYIRRSVPPLHPPSKRGGFGEKEGGVLSPFIFIDIGTGSGCIPVSVLKNRSSLSAIATDISGAALNVAKRNAKKHGVERRVRFFKSDLLSSVPPDILKGRELIVTANLPYVPTSFPVNPDIQFEPSLALYGGTDGLAIYRRFAEQLNHLKPRAIFLELFDFQVSALTQKLSDYSLILCKNLTGQARLAVFEKTG